MPMPGAALRDENGINYLNQLLADGKITKDEFIGIQQSAQPTNALPQMINPVSRGTIDQAQPGGGFQGLQSGQMVMQQTNGDGSENPAIQMSSNTQGQQWTADQAASVRRQQYAPTQYAQPGAPSEKDMLDRDWLRKQAGLPPVGIRGAPETSRYGFSSDDVDWLRKVQGVGPTESGLQYQQRMAEIAKQGAELAKTQASTGHTVAETQQLNDPFMRDLKQQEMLAQINHAKNVADMSPLQMAHMREQMRVSQMQNPDINGDGLNSGLTGQDLLDTLTPGIAAQVKAVAEGKMSGPRSINGKISPIMTLVGQYDPSFDMANTGARMQTAKDYAPGGKDGTKVQSINQAIHHVGLLSDSINSLNNSDVMPGIINAPINLFEQKMLGDTRQGVYKQQADAVASEMRKIYAGAGGGDRKSLEEWQSAFDPNAGKAQQRAYLNAGLNLLQGAIDSHKEAYTRGMGPKADFGKLISPDALSALDSVRNNTSPKQQLSPGQLPSLNLSGTNSASDALSPAEQKELAALRARFKR